jgi:hypothetical protein
MYLIDIGYIFGSKKQMHLDECSLLGGNNIHERLWYDSFDNQNPSSSRGFNVVGITIPLYVICPQMKIR